MRRKLPHKGQILEVHMLIQHAQTGALDDDICLPGIPAKRFRRHGIRHKLCRKMLFQLAHKRLRFLGRPVQNRYARCACFAYFRRHRAGYASGAQNQNILSPEIDALRFDGQAHADAIQRRSNELPIPVIDMVDALKFPADIVHLV